VGRCEVHRRVCRGGGPVAFETEEFGVVGKSAVDDAPDTGSNRGLEVGSCSVGSNQKRALPIADGLLVDTLFMALRWQAAPQTCRARDAAAGLVLSRSVRAWCSLLACEVTRCDDPRLVRDHDGLDAVA
jgi:hypothetical protein